MFVPLIVFLNSANLICRSTDISKCLIESLGFRDNDCIFKPNEKCNNKHSLLDNPQKGSNWKFLMHKCNTSLMIMQSNKQIQQMLSDELISYCFVQNMMKFLKFLARVWSRKQSVMDRWQMDRQTDGWTREQHTQLQTVLLLLYIHTAQDKANTQKLSCLS